MKPLRLPTFNWQRDALVSLGLSITAALYALVPDFQKYVCGFLLLAGLCFGIASVIKQIKSSRTKIIPFDASNWEQDRSGEWVLTIESDVMLFRVECPDESGNFEEVMGSVSSNPKGTLTFVRFSASTPGNKLCGRVVIR
jgi:hypothetical protein